MKAFLGLVLLIITTRAMTQSVVINEVCYSSKNLIQDFEGDTPDWIELYNDSDEPVQLRGYKLTDDTSKNEFWHFPSCEIQPHTFLMVFASDKDTVVKAEIHTDFKIAALKETLYLLDPDDHIIDKVSPQCVPSNLSLSRVPDGSSELFVTSPTPGKSNNIAEQIPVNYIRDTLIVSHASGFYNSPVEVSLSNLHPENKILYTLDGDDPDENEATYCDAILFKDRTPYENRFANEVEMEDKPGDLIFKGNVLRAVVYSNGCPASNAISNVYFVNPNIRTTYHVPVVSLITDENNLFDKETGIYTHGSYRNFDQHGGKWERPVHVEIFDTTGLQIIDQDAGVRIHGRGSRRTPQKSMRLYADPEYGAGTFNYPFFSQKPQINQFKVLLLRNTNGTMGPLFKEELCNYLVQDLDVDYQAGRTVILFINGEYWGIYNLMERENKDYIKSNFNLDDIEADIIAYDRHLVVEEGSMDAYNALISFFKSSDPSSQSFYEDLTERMDVPEMIDYFIAKLYLSDIDWPQSNLEIWKVRSDTARWRFFMFDSDGSMMWLDYNLLSEYNSQRDETQRFSEFSMIILRTAMQNETFREQFRRRFYELMNTSFSSSSVLKAINHFEAIYAPLVPEHTYRWNEPSDYPKWKSHVDELKKFAAQRPQMIMHQLENNFGNPLTLYPNPSEGSFNLDLVMPAEKVEVRIFSAKGILMYQWIGTYTGESPLELNTGLPAGFYIIQARTMQNSYIGKLIIQ